MEYTPKGVCSQQIHFDIVDHKVRNVSFRGGCNGNLQGISRLIDGMDVDEAIKRLDGIRCGFKPGNNGRHFSNGNLFFNPRLTPFLQTCLPLFHLPLWFPRLFRYTRIKYAPVHETD